MPRLLDHIDASGFPFTKRLIHVFIGGSELHGAKVQGTDDLDIYGVYIEPPELVLGMNALPHFVWSTAGNDRRNGPADVDVTLYSLRKWADLACKGNPTALHFLFAAGDPERPLWKQVRKSLEIFLSRNCARHFVGFARNQFDRLAGRKGRGKKGQRPELEQIHGYDTKAAMHGMRLLYECLEILRTGVITLPRPERPLLIRVRSGKYTLAEVERMAQQLFAECAEAQVQSPLPATVNRDAVSELLTKCYLDAWRVRASHSKGTS
jgi:predicted nucleotidyltransferase